MQWLWLRSLSVNVSFGEQWFFVQGERLADLQHEYMRVSRVADLSCALSRENIAKAGQLTQRLIQVNSTTPPSLRYGTQKPCKTARCTLELAGSSTCQRLHCKASSF